VRAPRPAGGLARHYSAVLQLLANGRLIPFLGAGAGLLGEPGTGPPTARELAGLLAGRFAMPELSDGDLARVAQYVGATIGRSALDDELRSIFPPDRQPNALHRLLAELPARFRAEGRPSLPAIATVSYDDTLERAFLEAGQPFDLLSYVARGPDAGRFLHISPDGAERIVGPTGDAPGLAHDVRTVIIRLHGGAGTRHEHETSYVITEDDDVHFAINAADRNFLPSAVARLFSESAFLFLGYSLRDLGIRVMLEALWSDRRSTSYRSWAILLSPHEIDVEIWRERQIEIIDSDLNRYTAELQEHLGGFDVAGLPV
jgi:hypothetical protein